MASATDMLRAKFCGILISRTVSSPESAPKNTISMPLFLRPASCRIGASGVPAHLAVPMPPVNQGKP